MRLRNRAQLIGHVGKDPQVHEFDEGTGIVTFSLATNDQYKKRNGEIVEQTTWHNCVAFGKTGELIQKYVKSGKEIAVEGKISKRKYEKEGIEREVCEIIISDFLLLGKKESVS